METESPDISTSCDVRCRISPEIEGLDITISRCTELVNLPDTDDNQEMKAILRASIDDAQKKKDALVRELRSLPPCTTFNCKVHRQFKSVLEEMKREYGDLTLHNHVLWLSHGNALNVWVAWK
ncbi:hypothetical protein TNIN_436041 [Trichonephila inaurata madagascariensis]|uniref:Uncharacterized protein n=1 Tax=Trichonephila inaurata madagascariensis TaxID=2747483 RepID=A0A8X7BZR1_9ARAC|nr:hypothetical protein TNIN_436041 [Trichonephila inaurata madagascariensis]